MTAITSQTERKRHDRPIRRAEKRRYRARMKWVSGVIRPHSSAWATADTAQGGKRLSSVQNQVILLSSGRQLGECRMDRSDGQR